METHDIWWRWKDIMTRKQIWRKNAFQYEWKCWLERKSDHQPNYEVEQISSGGTPQTSPWLRPVMRKLKTALLQFVKVYFMPDNRMYKGLPSSKNSEKKYDLSANRICLLPLCSFLILWGYSWLIQWFRYSDFLKSFIFCASFEGTLVRTPGGRETY